MMIPLVSLLHKHSKALAGTVNTVESVPAFGETRQKGNLDCGLASAREPD